MKSERWILIFFCVGFVVGMMVVGMSRWVAAPTPPILMGDINRDGRVNAVDLTMMRRHIIGIYNLTPNQIRIGDVNHNGRIDERDIDALTDIIMERPVRTYVN